MDEAQIMDLVAATLGVTPAGAERQTFGHNSVTYDVALPNENVIVRTNADPNVFAQTEQNIRILASLGLPVPHVRVCDLTCAHISFAYMILDKIPGRDLRYQLPSMTPAQMTRLAEQIVDFQRLERVMNFAPVFRDGRISRVASLRPDNRLQAGK